MITTPRRNRGGEHLEALLRLSEVELVAARLVRPDVRTQSREQLCRLLAESAVVDGTHDDVELQRITLRVREHGQQLCKPRRDRLGAIRRDLLLYLLERIGCGVEFRAEIVVLVVIETLGELADLLLERPLLALETRFVFADVSCGDEATGEDDEVDVFLLEVGLREFDVAQSESVAAVVDARHHTDAADVVSLVLRGYHDYYSSGLAMSLTSRDGPVLS